MNLLEPDSFLSSLDFAIRGVRLSIAHETDMKDNKHILSARIGVHYINFALSRQIDIAGEGGCSLELLRDSTELLHQMYNYEAKILGINYSSARPPMEGDKSIQDVLFYLNALVPEFKKYVLRKNQFKFEERFPVFEMFPLEDECVF
jgi:hypothetical protein